MAATPEEEAIIKTRFLIQASVSKGEPPFKRLVKRYLQFCHEVQHGTASKADEHLKQLLWELAGLEMQATKLERQAYAYQQEQSSYQDKQHQLETDIEQAKEGIEQKKIELEEARVWRKQNEEYEELRHKVMEFPSRSQTEAGIQQLTEEIKSIEAEGARLALLLEKRKRQAAILLATMQELSSSIDADDVALATAAELGLGVEPNGDGGPAPMLEG